MRALVTCMVLASSGRIDELTPEELQAVKKEMSKTNELIDSTDVLLNQLEDEVPFGELIEG